MTDWSDWCSREIGSGGWTQGEKTWRPCLKMHFDHPHGGGCINGARQVKGGIFRHTLHTVQEVDLRLA